ncbi:MAG: ArsA family ATPase [Chloroflexota bacterium]|nr:ArsA family ATPase [Chloroflexota bacterium]
MSLASLDQNSKRVLVFGGKGGVGKTTASAATALHYALAGRRTLMISSDLAPSLSDIFETRIGATETLVPGIANLSALEIDTDEVMQRWKRKFGQTIYDAASVVVDMPYDEIINYVAMAPGIQEEFMLDFIMEQVRDARYDLIVWDTAPAGDTLRLLDLPQRFLTHLRAAPRVYFKAQDVLGLSKTPFLKIIEEWTQLSEQVVQFFRDPANVEFLLVTIPEGLGVYQSRRVIADLAEHGLAVRHIIINGVVADPDGDFLRQRMRMQQPYIQMLCEEYGADALIQLPLLPYEVKGVERLREVERRLFPNVAD